MFFICFVCLVWQDMIRNRYVDTKYVIVSNFKTDVCWHSFWGIDTKYGIIGPPNRKEMSRRDIGQRKTSIYVCQAINNLVENPSSNIYNPVLPIEDVLHKQSSRETLVRLVIGLVDCVSY